MEKQCTKCHSKEILIKHPVRKWPNGNPEEFYVCSNKKCPYHKFSISEEELSQAILSAEERAREEVYKLAKKILTEDISHSKFIDDGRKIWSVKGLKNRGIEPCYECGNREKIVKFLQALSLPDQKQLKKGS